MKLQISIIFLAFVSCKARKVTSHAQKKKILSKSRRVSERKLGEDDDEEEEYAFLQNYKMKMISCKAGETIRNAENGEYEMSAIVYRMCPSSEDCDDETTMGCKDGYGDYVVGLNTFVQAYMEEQAENMQDDDNFDINRYAECAEYENDNDDGNGVQYFIGPTCSEDGTDIKLELFYDEYCTQVPEDVTFEQVSNGWSMPYSDGGLVSTYCTSCKELNDDGEYQTKEMCERLYESSGKCETNMEYYNYYKQEGSCEYIEELLPKLSVDLAGYFFIGTIVFIVAFVIYFCWWKKQKRTSAIQHGRFVN